MKTSGGANKRVQTFKRKKEQKNQWRIKGSKQTSKKVNKHPKVQWTRKILAERQTRGKNAKPNGKKTNEIGGDINLKTTQKNRCSQLIETNENQFIIK